jgi:hypothetical protein
MSGCGASRGGPNEASTGDGQAALDVLVRAGALDRGYEVGAPTIHNPLPAAL